MQTIGRRGLRGAATAWRSAVALGVALGALGGQAGAQTAPSIPPLDAAAAAPGAAVVPVVDPAPAPAAPAPATESLAPPAPAAAPAAEAARAAEAAPAAATAPVAQATPVAEPVPAVDPAPAVAAAAADPAETVNLDPAEDAPAALPDAGAPIEPALAQTPARPAVPGDARGAALHAALGAVFGDDVAPVIAYAARGYAPLWVEADGRGATPAASALIAALRAAPGHGLPARRYDAEGLAARLGLASPGTGPASAPAQTPALDAWAATEVAATRAFLRYARDVSSGVLEPRRVDREIIVTPPRPDAQRLIADMGAAADPGSMLAGLAPADPTYARLRAEWATLATPDAWGPPVPAGPTLKPQDRGARVAALRARLIALGDHAPQDRSGQTPPPARVALNDPAPGVASDLSEPDLTGDPRVYDAELEASVRAFQARHGLNADGAVGPATLAALNTAPATRAAQIAVNLERLRWLNKDLGARHVRVNLADFTMALVDNGAPSFTTRVVVGKSPRNRTPEFSDEMEYMVVNPSWYVPSSIAREEILPALKADPGYLRRKNMSLIGADADSIDWGSVSPGSFPGRVRQGPGPGNALGRVKFMFPNDYAIYLHDTPSKSLFARDVRAFSHGCVRVDRPFDFAHALLAPQEADPVAAFDGWLSTGREKQVTLDEPVPVHLTYATAWIDAAGQRQFRADIYGRDKKVAAALVEAGVVLPD